LFENSDLNEIMVDMTPTLTKYAAESTKKIGKLLVGFSNPQKEEIYKVEGTIKTANANIQLLRRFVQLREDLISDYESDYVILDTSPGIRYWSINSLAIADVLFLTLKFGDLDIEGTIKMANDIYGSFTKFGSKSFLLLNLVSGYCIPRTHILSSQSKNKSNSSVPAEGTPIKIQTFENELGSDTFLSDQTKMDLISAIPCYCDIQFQRKEFLTVLQYPDHPFAKQLEQLATKKQIGV
jgi:chromosome partitioning protein